MLDCEAPLLFPANVVLVSWRWPDDPSPYWAAAPMENLVPVEGLQYDFVDFWTPAEPFAPGETVYEDFTCLYETGDYVDVTPPSAPTVVGGSITHTPVGGGDDGCFASGEVNSCQPSTALVVDIIEAEDDHTPRERLTYAVYIGSAPAQASTTPKMSHLLYADASLRDQTQKEFAERTTYVTVSAIDMAGNESERSEAFKINDPADDDGGCAVSSASSRGSVIVMLGMAWLALVARRRWR